MVILRECGRSQLGLERCLDANSLHLTPSRTHSNWMIPAKVVKGMGGAMDLVSSPDHTKVVVLTDHVDKNGRSKIVHRTKLPLTGSRCVSRIITDLCVFNVDRKGEGGLTCIELMEGVTLDEVREKTDAKFEVGEGVK